ncbi:hypothetical protein [Embleya sp. NBC_00888]|uniref:hypothetical protein n=1 Tax=Embleya sp. NBC_00888 TaxID=2975960 RepID=UPI00386E5C6B
MARHVRCSAAVVSHHTAVLRDSGLILTHRDGLAVRHVITDLGALLLGTDDRQCTPDDTRRLPEDPRGRSAASTDPSSLPNPPHPKEPCSSSGSCHRWHGGFVDGAR